MPLVSVHDLLQRHARSDELGALASDEDAPALPAGLIKALAKDAGNDLSMFTPADIANGQAAIVRINVALDDAAAQVQALGILLQTPVPSVLVGIVVDLAVYRLYGARLDEMGLERYKNAVKLLDKIAAGQIRVIGQDAANAQESGCSSSILGFESAPARFGRRALNTGHDTDPDLP